MSCRATSRTTALSSRTGRFHDRSGCTALTKHPRLCQCDQLVFTCTIVRKDRVSTCTALYQIQTALSVYSKLCTCCRQTCAAQLSWLDRRSTSHCFMSCTAVKLPDHRWTSLDGTTASSCPCPLSSSCCACCPALPGLRWLGLGRVAGHLTHDTSTTHDSGNTLIYAIPSTAVSAQTAHLEVKVKNDALGTGTSSPVTAGPP